jgi:hypothetical protein
MFTLRAMLLLTLWIWAVRELVGHGAIEWLLDKTEYKNIESEENEND